MPLSFTPDAEEASSQAWQMLSVPCSQPSGRHSTATSTQASAALRLAANVPGRQQLQPQLQQPDAPGPPRIRGAPDPSADAPWMHRPRPRPALARDRRAQHLLLPAPAQPELQPEVPTPQQRLRAAQRRDDLMSWQWQILPAPIGRTHGRPSAQQPWTDRDVWWPGVCYTASCSLEPSIGHPQRHASITPLPPCGLPETACHSQPRHAQLPSPQGSLANCGYMVSGHSAASFPTARRPPAGRRQAWSLAGCRRVCQPMAGTSPPGHHPAMGGILPLTLTAR